MVLGIQLQQPGGGCGKGGSGRGGREGWGRARGREGRVRGARSPGGGSGERASGRCPPPRCSARETCRGALGFGPAWGPRVGARARASEAARPRERAQEAARPRGGAQRSRPPGQGRGLSGWPPGRRAVGQAGLESGPDCLGSGRRATDSRRPKRASQVIQTP